ncbi:MAG: hypothetical protein AB7E55_02565 [Pigmentiphaga sp.]
MRRDEDGIVALDICGTEVLVVDDKLDVGCQVRGRIAAQDVSIAREPSANSSILNALPARIVGIDRLGPGKTVLLERIEQCGAIIASAG